MHADKTKSTKTRDSATCVRLSEKERARIEKMRQATGLSYPVLLKRALFERMDLEKPLFNRNDADELLLELRRHGNNLNQIGKKVNSGIRYGWNKSFDSLMTAYRVLEHKLTVNRANG
jgi:hypothetical protein